MFQLIKDNFLLSQVFFELARDTPAGRAAPPLHALNIAELLRHTRLSDGDRLFRLLYRDQPGLPDSAK